MPARITFVKLIGVLFTAHTWSSDVPGYALLTDGLKLLFSQVRNQLSGRNLVLHAPTARGSLLDLDAAEHVFSHHLLSGPRVQCEFDLLLAVDGVDYLHVVWLGRLYHLQMRAAALV